MDKEALEGELKAWVASKTRLISLSELTGEMSLFSSGLLDSILFVQLINFIDKARGLRLTPALGANMTAMDNIEGILRVVARAEEKLRSGPA